jgi:hypothetical protein
MSSCAAEMRNALDTFFKDQSEVKGTCLVDYVQFDNKIETVFTDRYISEAEAVLQPRGATALLDAVGKSVTELGERLAGKNEQDRPGTVIVVVVTDGYENASQEWNADKVKELIKQQEDKYNWNFTFLGANMDAVAVGASFGFSSDTSMTFDTHYVGAASASLSNYATVTRGGGKGGYSDEDRKRAVGESS